MGASRRRFDQASVIDDFDPARARRNGLNDCSTAMITSGEQLRGRLLALGVIDEPGIAATLAQFESLRQADQGLVLARMEREAEEDARPARAAITDEIARPARRRLGRRRHLAPVEVERTRRGGPPVESARLHRPA